MGLKASIQDPQQRQKQWRQETKSPKIKPHPPQIQTFKLRVTMRFLYHAPILLLEVASVRRPSFLLPHTKLRWRTTRLWDKLLQHKKILKTKEAF